MIGTASLSLAYASERRLRPHHPGPLDYDDSLVPGQIVASVRARGGEAWYVTARDEGHDIRHRANQDAWLQTVAQFLKKLAP